MVYRTEAGELFSIEFLDKAYRDDKHEYTYNYKITFEDGGVAHIQGRLQHHVYTVDDGDVIGTVDPIFVTTHAHLMDVAARIYADQLD